MGKYEIAGKKAMLDGALDFSGNDETAAISLKVLDAIVENSKELSVKSALMVLDDAKAMLLQLLGL